MASSNMTSIKSMLPALEAALTSFLSSKANFRLLEIVRPRPDTTPTIHDATPSRPHTLIILDSSYNPPSRAHLALARNALSNSDDQPTPHRLLLLFSTHNADKKNVDPKLFLHRIAMMVLFAGDLQRQLAGDTRRGSMSQSRSVAQGSGGAETTSEAQPDAPTSGVEIDIGLTKSPYYTDKSLGITSAVYEEGGERVYPSDPSHIHLLGYDTVTRFLAAKYYPSYDPPLSAVAPYFEAGHKLRVLLRPDDGEKTSETEQRAWVEGLGQGSLEKEGFKSAWGEQVSVVERIEERTKGISSTKIRAAVKRGDWDAVDELCSEGVTAYVKEMGLYADE